MIKIEDKGKCCGCTACTAVCLKKCITMVYDDEGFLYPSVDLTSCVDCHRCESVCPYVSEKTVSRSDRMLRVAVQNNDEIARRFSTSGGAFSALAEWTIGRGGTVYACGYDRAMHVLHMKVADKEGIGRLRMSKYVQSDMQGCINSLIKDLKNGIDVLFVGTPCQAEGVAYALNGRQYSNLYLADIKCYGVPSPGLWDEFLKYLADKYKEGISDFRFRDKKYGYSGVNVQVVTNSGKRIEDRLEIKSYSKTMFSRLGLRRCCYDCRFCTMKKTTDFTLGDFWEVGSYNKEFDDNKGTTLLEIHTKKGENLYNELIRTKKVRGVEIDILQGETLSNYLLAQAKHYSFDEAKRTEFFSMVGKVRYDELMKHYFPDTLKDRINNIAKPILHCFPGSNYIFYKQKLKKVKRQSKG